MKRKDRDKITRGGVRGKIMAPAWAWDLVGLLPDPSRWLRWV